MKIIVTGSLGNIGKPLTQQLVAAGHHVTVVSSTPEKQVAIEAIGALAAIGSVADESFLTDAFQGADGVFTMVPPNLTTGNFRGYATGVAAAYVSAIRKAGVKRVVNLSSMGAHLAAGTGPIKVNHPVEKILNTLDGVAVRHLRPPFFYNNLYGNIDMVKHMGVLGANYPGTAKLYLIDPMDIAAAAAAALQAAFTGKSVIYLAGDERTNSEIAAVLGAAIGKPHLPWVEFTDTQAREGMQQGGLSAEMADLFIEMGHAVKSGIIWEDFSGTLTGGTRLETFARSFARVYQPPELVSGR